jgi:membrane-associated sensor protein
VTVDVLVSLFTTANESMPSTLPVFERSYIYWNGLLLLAFLALALLWARRHSVLDLWLMVVMCGLLIELFLIFLVGRRYVVGWYAARLYFLISSTLVLAILLSETALLYRRLARSVVAQSREREARLMTIGVLSAAIAHEVSASGISIRAAGQHRSIAEKATIGSALYVVRTFRTVGGAERFGSSGSRF